MFIGALKEDNKGDDRVSISPETSKKLVEKGFKVILEKNAGNLSNYLDEQYVATGATIETRENVLKNS